MGRFHRVLLLSVVFTVPARLASAACSPFDPPSIVAVGDRPNALAAGDINGDGFLDLVVGISYDVSVLFGDGAGSFTTGPRTPVLAGPRAIFLTDFNGDSRLDLVVDGGYAVDVELQILLGTGTGAFISSQSFVGNTS